MAIKAVTETRGTFVQETRATLFLLVSDSDGNAQDADSR